MSNIHLGRFRRGLFVFMGITAVVCGVLLILTDGMGMSRAELDQTPFESFLVPGLILAVVVGGSQLLASGAVPLGHPPGRDLALAAACILLGWIVVQSLMIDGGRAFQAFIGTYAIAELRLSLHLVEDVRHDRPTPGAA